MSDRFPGAWLEQLKKLKKCAKGRNSWTPMQEGPRGLHVAIWYSGLKCSNEIPLLKQTICPN